MTDPLSITPALPPTPPSAVGLVRLLAALLQPYTPSLSAKVLLQLNLPDSALLLNDELIQVGGLSEFHRGVRCGLRQRRWCLDRASWLT